MTRRPVFVQVTRSKVERGVVWLDDDTDNPFESEAGVADWLDQVAQEDRATGFGSVVEEVRDVELLHVDDAESLLEEPNRWNSKGEFSPLDATFSTFVLVDDAQPGYSALAAAGYTDGGLAALIRSRSMQDPFPRVARDDISVKCWVVTLESYGALDNVAVRYVGGGDQVVERVDDAAKFGFKDNAFAAMKRVMSRDKRWRRGSYLILEPKEDTDG